VSLKTSHANHYIMTNLIVQVYHVAVYEKKYSHSFEMPNYKQTKRFADFLMKHLSLQKNMDMAQNRQRYYDFKINGKWYSDRDVMNMYSQTENQTA
jgi:hypothetical protein